LTVTSVVVGVRETSLVAIGLGTVNTFDSLTGVISRSDRGVGKAIKIDELASNEISANDWFTVGFVNNLAMAIIRSTRAVSRSGTLGSVARVSILAFGVIKSEVRSSHWVTARFLATIGRSSSEGDGVAISRGGVTEGVGAKVSSVVGAQSSELAGFGGIVTDSNLTFIGGSTTKGDSSSTSGNSTSDLTVNLSAGGTINQTSLAQSGFFTSSGSTEDWEARVSGHTEVGGNTLSIGDVTAGRLARVAVWAGLFVERHSSQGRMGLE